MRWLPNAHWLGKRQSALEDCSEQRPSQSDTLLIIAGPCGSGKSTLLQAAFKERLPLFGDELMDCFRSSCRDKSYKEYNDYKKARRKKSFFQAGHVKLLGLENVLPQNVLLHVDLYQVLRGIDPSCWPQSLKWREFRRELFGRERFKHEGASVRLGKRSFSSLQEPAENDQMMQSYLQCPFFKRFKRIVINTIRCDYAVNSLQLAGRKAKARNDASILEQRQKFFLAPDAMAQSIHAELYASWARNLSTLNPSAVFTTQVSESGDLLLNGTLLVAEWSKRFQRMS